MRLQAVGKRALVVGWLLSGCAAGTQIVTVEAPAIDAQAADRCAMDVRRLLADELALRPAAEPADLYLLLREALLGPPEEQADEAELAAELASLEPSATEPIIEDLDEVRGTVRLNLRKWRFIRGSAAELAEVVNRGAGEPRDAGRLEACARVAPAALESLGGDGAALEAWLRDQGEDPWSSVEHSGKYRKHYRPAYRVVYRRHLPPWVTAPPPSTG